jgi:hypothetical protein
MALEDVGAERRGELHRNGVGGILVRRPADAAPGIALAEAGDVGEVAGGVGGRIDRHAVHEREIAGAMVEEADEIVDLLLGQTAGRGDDRQAACCDGLEQRPVARRAARDLDDVEAHRDDAIDRGLVEGGAHRQQLVAADRRQQLAELIPRQPCREEARHVLVRAGAAVIAMDEMVEVAELKLDRSADSVPADDLGAAVDDRRAVRDAALVVVSQVQHERVAEVELARFSHRVALWNGVRGQAVASASARQPLA